MYETNAFMEMESKVLAHKLLLVNRFIGFYGTSTFVGYLTPNPFSLNNQFYFKQFSLA